MNVVLKQADNILVYTIKPEGKERPLRSLHRDLLLPCGFLPATPIEKPPEQTLTKRPRAQSGPDVESEEEVNSDSEDLTVYRLPYPQIQEPDIVDTTHTIPEHDRSTDTMTQQTTPGVDVFITTAECPPTEVDVECNLNKWRRHSA